IIGTKDSGKPIKRKVNMVTLVNHYVQPEMGYDASMIVHDKDWESVGLNGESMPRGAISFHELYEMYEMEEKEPGTSRYPESHNNTEAASESLPANDERKNSSGMKGIRKSKL